MPQPPVNGSDAPRTLLVGTALSVRQMVHTLALLDTPPRVLGCVLPPPPP